MTGLFQVSQSLADSIVVPGLSEAFQALLLPLGDASRVAENIDQRKLVLRKVYIFPNHLGPAAFNQLTFLSEII